MFIASKYLNDLHELKELLETDFKMKDLELAKRIIGMDVKRDKEKGILTSSQSNYVKKVQDCMVC